MSSCISLKIFFVVQSSPISAFGLLYTLYLFPPSSSQPLNCLVAWSTCEPCCWELHWARSPGLQLHRQRWPEPSHAAEPSSVVCLCCSSAEAAAGIADQHCCWHCIAGQWKETWAPVQLSDFCPVQFLTITSDSSLLLLTTVQRCFPQGKSVPSLPGYRQRAASLCWETQTSAYKNWGRDLCSSDSSVCYCPRHLDIPPASELFVYFSVTSELNSDLQAVPSPAGHKVCIAGGGK